MVLTGEALKEWANKEAADLLVSCLPLSDKERQELAGNVKAVQEKVPQTFPRVVRLCMQSYQKGFFDRIECAGPADQLFDKQTMLRFLNHIMKLYRMNVVLTEKELNKLQKQLSQSDIIIVKK